MSIWNRISAAVSALANGEGLSAVFERLRNPPEQGVGFTIAVIALSAKMAKADGRVTRDEVTAFREVFQIAQEDEKAAARVFNLARQDIAGFEEYASRIKRMFRSEPATLTDLMEGLFHIAVADGTYHSTENLFLTRVAEIFDLPDAVFRAMRARFVPSEAQDPYAVLGVSGDASLEEIHAVWRQLARECHPDQMQARGVPVEALRIAERRMAAVNSAWEEIQKARG